MQIFLIPQKCVVMIKLLNIYNELKRNKKNKWKNIMDNFKYSFYENSEEYFISQTQQYNNNTITHESFPFHENNS